MPDSLHQLLHQLASKYDLEIHIDEDLAQLNAPSKAKTAQLDLVTIRRLIQHAEGPDIRIWLEARVKMAAQALSSKASIVQPHLLLPHVRPMRRAGEPHWSEPLAHNQLSVALVEDRGETLRLLQPMQIVQTGHSIHHLKEMAHEHLFRITSPIHLVKHPSHGCLHCVARDGHSASRALIAHQIIPDPAGLLFLIPSRDQLWLIPGSMPGAFDLGWALRAAATQHAQTHPYPISAELFANRQGQIHHLTGPEWA